MIAGFLAQFPGQPDEAVAAAVYLHGLAGEIGARALGEKCLIATDILRYLPGRHGGVCRRIGRRLKKRPSPWESGWRARCLRAAWCCSPATWARARPRSPRGS